MSLTTDRSGTRLEPRPGSSGDQPEPLAWTHWLFLALLAGFAGLVVRNAWLSDDAYITFRTVDNFVNGHGLTWNVAERVQAYTHPLWMLLISAAYAATREVFFTSLAISIGLSVISVVLVARLADERSPLPALAVGVLALSKGFIDYATSGLENPLTHLLLAAFLLIYVRREWTPGWILRLSLCTALGMVNRVDTVLLFGPALAWAWIETRGWRALGYAALGFAPLIAWELFSLVTYGALVPNTALAKLNTGLIPQTTLIHHGLTYLYNSLRVDPITLLTISVGVLLPISTRDWRKLSLTAGIVLYLAYIVRVGGDFMSGRFLTAPLLLATALIVSAPWSRLSPRPRRVQAALLVVLALVGLSSPYTPLRAPGGRRADQDADVWVLGRTIKDERANYYPTAGLLPALRSQGDFPDHDWAVLGRAAREKGPHVVVKGSVGFYGYFAGPEVTIVDILGLGDPLLARLPVADPDWQIGHYGRLLPEGYVETLESGEARIADPALAAYHDRLTLVTRGDLWDPVRLREVLRMVTGRYDGLLDAYAYRVTPELDRSVTIINPTDHSYVYAYVWNAGSGSVYLLDDASSLGRAYEVRWRISPQGVTFEGDHLRVLSTKTGISDSELLNVGAIFSPDDALTAYEMVERRFWFGIESDTGDLRIIHPARDWRNPDAPGGYWQSADLSDILTFAP